MALFILAIGSVFHEAVGTIVQSWDKEEYSHGILIPPIALLLILHRLAQKPQQPKPSWIGAVLVGMGLVIHLFGQLSGITVFPQYGFFLAVLGLFYALLGARIFLNLWGALAYLFFAVPLPTTLYISLSAKLQLLSSSLGTDLLQFIGVTVFREGNIIDLGLYKLQVVEACSGLRYIFPLLSFSYLIAYFYKDAFWKRALVFMSAIPLAVLMNVVRIAFVGVTVNVWGVAAAEGVLHDFEGWVVFGACVVLLFAEVSLLRLIGKTRGDLDLNIFSLPKGPYFSSPFRLNRVFAALMIVFCLIGVGQASDFIAPKAEIIPPRESFASFPSEIGPWHARFENLGASEVDLLKLSDFLNATFQKPEDTTPPVHFFVAYYKSQRNDNNLHSPEMCLPGSGWQALSTRILHLNPGQNGKGFSVVRTVVEKGTSKQIVYYWFEQAGHSSASRLGIKGQTLLNALSTGRTDSALLRLETPLSPQETEADADRRLQDFLTEIFPQLKPFIPD